MTLVQKKLRIEANEMGDFCVWLSEGTEIIMSVEKMRAAIFRQLKEE